MTSISLTLNSFSGIYFAYKYFHYYYLKCTQLFKSFVCVIISITILNLSSKLRKSKVCDFLLIELIFYLFKFLAY